MFWKLSEDEKRNMKCSIHVLPNTHWDREWRFPFQETRMHLIDLLDRLLDLMERRPEYRYFNFDSQTVFLDDYLELRPENRPRLEALIRARRLIVGPWWTLPEMNVIHGESIARNLLKGLATAAEFGFASRVGYTPTSYGQVSQIAQIYAEFGIDGMIFYRGLHSVECGNEYILEAPDGSRVLGVRLSPNVGRGAFYLYIERPSMVPDGWTGYRWEDGWLPFHLCRLDRDHEEEPRLLAAPFTETWNPNPVRAGVEAAMQEALQDATSPVFALFDGMDSTGPCPHLPRLIEECNKVNPNWHFQISSLPNFLKELKAKVNTSRLVVLKGERRRPSHDKAFNAFLKDSISARMYLKIRNAEVERALMQWSEPFGLIASRLGAEYPAPALALAWKYLLTNHSHDAISGLSPDQIHQDMMGRFDQAFLIAEACMKKSLGAVVSHINTSDAEPGDVLITAFNPDPVERTDVVECFIDMPMSRPGEDYRPFSIEGPDGAPVAYQTFGREPSYLIATEKNWLPSVFHTWKWRVAFEAAGVPAMGFATFRVKPQPWPRMHNHGTLCTAANVMENEFLRVAIETNGTLTVTDRRTGEVYRNINFFEDAGESGDCWWRWAPPADRVFNTLGLAAQITREIDGPVLTTFSIRWTMMLPQGVTQNKLERAAEEKPLQITSFVTLKRGVPRLEVRTVVQNTVCDHRLRMMAEAGFRPERSFAHTAFDVVERPVHLDDTHDWLEQWTGTHPMNGLHGISNGRRGLAVLSFGLTEYEVIEDEHGTVATTLLRTFQYPKMSGLFREDRIRREGNEGSQMLGRQEFRYAFCFFSGSWREAGLLRQMQEFRHPLLPVQHGRHAGRLFGRRQSFMRLDPPVLTLTALKKAEKGNNAIVRFYNPTDGPVKGRLRSHFAIRRVWQCSMEEKRRAPLKVSGDGHEVRLDVPAKKIITLELQLQAAAG
ncbi:MAG: hypothetical protein Kow0059_11340 [Candidatus Sumerlaeia bacterium]